MQKSPIKLLSNFLRGLFFVYLCIILIFNIHLLISKEAILESIEPYFPTKVTANYIYSLWPTQLNFCDVSIAKDQAMHEPLITFPVLEANFSPLQSLVKREITLSSVQINQSKINYHQFTNYIERYTPQLLVILQNLPKQVFLFSLNEAMIDLAQYGHHPDYITTSIDIEFNEHGLKSGSGFFRRDKYQFNPKTIQYKITEKGWPIHFDFNGDPTAGGFTFHKFDIIGQSLESKLRGALAGNKLNLKGYAFINNNPKKLPLSLSIKKTETSKEKTKSALEKRLIYILDIDSDIIFLLPRIKVQKFDFTFNNDPMQISGDMDLSWPILFKLNGKYVPSESSRNKSNRIESAELNVLGLLQHKVLSSDCIFSLKLKNPSAGDNPKQIESEFKNLSFFQGKKRNLIMNIKEGKFSFSDNTLKHGLLFQTLKAQIYSKKAQEKTIEIQSSLYDGKLSGEVNLDFNKSPMRFYSHFFIEDVAANELGEFWDQFSKVNGRLASEFEMTNHPDLDIKGSMAVRHGHLNNLEFFQWLADNFGIESLKKVPFQRASSDFTFTPDKYGMQNIVIDSKNVKLSGYYNVDKNDLVSSQLSLTLTKDLLQESKKLLPLLKLFAQSTLRFDFLLSGKQDDVNFQWIPSEVKQKIEDRIPGFIKVKIEQNLE